LLLVVVEVGKDKLAEVALVVFVLVLDFPLLLEQVIPLQWVVGATVLQPVKSEVHLDQILSFPQSLPLVAAVAVHGQLQVQIKMV
jgi:hypothetical protein